MAVPPFDYEATLHACAQGDQDLFQALYRQEAPRMLALCMKMLTQREAAEDAVRDTFVLIWKNAGNYDRATGTARAWVYSILRYRVLNQIRRTGRPTNAVDDTLAAQHHTDGVSCLAVHVQNLAHLDDSQRLPLLMAFYCGQTLEQIAERLVMPVDEIRARLRTGLDAMQGQAA